MFLLQLFTIKRALPFLWPHTRRWNSDRQKNNDFLKLEIALISISIVFDFLLHDDDDDDAM